LVGLAQFKKKKVPSFGHFQPPSWKICNFSIWLSYTSQNGKSFGKKYGITNGAIEKRFEDTCLGTR
jgi:hypothetical protein